MSGFDPYHKWLGISPKDQPPNHYRLLGVDVFETDADTIASAADRQMVHVRSFQTGRYSAYSQWLLNEIAAAKVCLLIPGKKAEYDLRLRSQLSPPQQPPEVVPAAPTVEPPIVIVSDKSDLSLYRRRKKQSASLPTSWILVGGGALLAVVLFGVIANQGARRETNSPTTRERSEWDRESQRRRNDAEPKQHAITRQASIGNTPTPIPAKLKLARNSSRIPEPDFQEAEDHGTDLEEPGSDAEPQRDEDSTAVVQKLPVPDAAALGEAIALIRDVYKDETDKAALAHRLAQRAHEAGDSVERFALLREAVNAAAEAWQGELAFQTIDLLAQDFDLSASKLKAEVLETAAKRAGATPAQKAAVAAAALQVVDEAMADDDFDTAKRLGRQANRLARDAKDSDLITTVVARNKKVIAAAQAFDEARRAIARLEEAPDDPQANTIVGRYLCLTKNDWQRGLPMLLLGDDETLRSLAELEIAGAASADRQVELGNAWWDAGIKQRAAHWYAKALPAIGGLSRDKLEAKIHESGLRKVFLADLAPVSFDVLGGNVRHATTVLIGGKTPTHGLWGHPPRHKRPSNIVYNVRGDFLWLSGAVAIADGAHPITPLTFRIDADGRTLWRSRPLQQPAVTEAFFVNVESAKQLQLIVECPGKLDNAWAVWIDPILTSPATSAGAEQPSTPPKSRFAARIFAACDDYFELYVNGAKVLEGRDTRRDFTADCLLCRGDIITVKCHNIGGARGFAAAIVFKKRRGIVTGAGWKSYRPKSEQQWYNPENIAHPSGVVPGDNKGLAEVIQKACKVPAPAIWGQGDTCYLFYMVR